MTAVAMFLLGVLAGWVTQHFLIHRPDRRNRAAIHAAVVAAKDDTVAAAIATGVHLRATITSLQQTVRQAREDRDWERLQRTITEAERDMFATAFRGLLTNAARVEDVGTVVEFRARGAL